MKLTANPTAPIAMVAPITWARRRPAADTAIAGPIRHRANPRPMTPAAKTPPSGTARRISGDSATPAATVRVAARFRARAASTSAAVRSASSRVRLTGRTMTSSTVPDSTSRVSAIVHHGGAGTTTTASRSGTPQVVVPQIGDQPS
ncbi:nucleotide disphospho-sugar-binding domain-containing protein [Streptomyces virginiae]